MGALIETTSGGVTTRGSGSINVEVFYRKDLKSKVMILHEAERDQTAGIKNIKPAEVTPSGAAVTGKVWVDKRNEYPENSYLKIVARVSKTGIIFSNVIEMLYIQLRSTGPLNELAVECPTDQNSTRSRVYVIGRFDILRPDEVKERGLHIGTNGSDESMNYETLADSTVFSNEVKEKALATREGPVKNVIVKTATGVTKSVPKLRLKRRLNLS